jgi:hypothetical protein
MAWALAAVLRGAATTARLSEGGEALRRECWERGGERTGKGNTNMASRQPMEPRQVLPLLNLFSLCFISVESLEWTPKKFQSNDKCHSKRGATQSYPDVTVGVSQSDELVALHASRPQVQT